jgi:hypothetical protein
MIAAQALVCHHTRIFDFGFWILIQPDFALALVPLAGRLSRNSLKNHLLPIGAISDRE